VKNAIIGMAAAPRHPGVLDAAEVEDVVHVRPLRSLVVEAADEEAVTLGTAIELDADRVTGIATVEHRSVRYEANRLWRCRGPAPHNRRPP
jgi:hypothetical protein